MRLYLQAKKKHMFSKIILHKVGNKINQEPVIISSEMPQFTEDMKEMLTEFFLKALKSEEHFHFYSDSYLANNPVYSAVSEIFEQPENFIAESAKIAQHLYDAAENPRVQNGELFVAYFDDEETQRIGIFKTENKEGFLKIFENEGAFELEKDFGVALSKVDKAAIIYNQHKEDGYVISAADHHKNGDLYYWFEDFLKIKQREDDYFHTQETLAVYKDYIVKQLPQEFDVSKADQADFLNRTLNFFKEKEEFKYDAFVEEVLEDEQVIESFSNFKTDYEQEYQLNIAEEFPINQAAVKKNQRHFKSVIKLDKNFHIYVHGDRKRIETGEDEKGKYYRLYFDQEK